MALRHLRYLNIIPRAKVSGVSRLWHDLYHLLLTISWPGLLGLIGLLFVAANVLFALAYIVGGDCIENARPGSFLDAFFFSVQTMATIGYGAMYPRTIYANIMVMIEVLVGLLGFAMATGLMFAKFSRPTARVLFSNVAVVTLFNRVPTLMFRMANKRFNQILEAQVQMNLVRNETTAEGQFMRRFHDLRLVRSRTPIFSLTWTAMHTIDEMSPLYGATADSLAKAEAEIVITLTGIDETVSQTIYARHSFVSQKILWNMRFVDILSNTQDRRISIDYTRFHDVIPDSKQDKVPG
jgi:inward rectifier potassium channel